MRVEVRPELLQWARKRSGIDDETFHQRFPRFEKWQRKELHPTLKQLEHFAQATHTPIGYLFLAQPPEEVIPIPDFRTIENKRIKEPTPNLLETIYICQQRQEWYRNFALSTKEAPLHFVGSATVRDKIESTAETIRTTLGFSIEERRTAPSWTDALRRFIDQADKIGVLIMVNGVVGNNNYRKLDSNEFRGFALSDSIAPLIFINGADTKAAQMFTLAHELAHIWLGQSALSDVKPVTIPANEVELWCNRVAAEVLVPLDILQRELTASPRLRNRTFRFALQGQR